jgi:N6-adenosine-specific RNA methylase IME4
MEELPRDHYGVILADPPWRFQTWSPLGEDRAPDYETMSLHEIADLPVGPLAKRHSVLFLWVTWPLLEHGLKVIRKWGFTYKTCGFAWMKADVRQMEMFDDREADMGTGYWTRANSEVCLLATKGRPKRIDAGIRQGIIEPRREHSRKPSIVHHRIERLVEGPYLELFARAPRHGWTTWGKEANRFPGTNFPLTLASSKDPGVA